MQLFGVRLVPRLWLLGKRRNSRIFQHKSVREIVGEVLGEADVPHAWQLTRALAPRPYCVQYQETDLAFLTRILAEEGDLLPVPSPQRVFAHRAARGVGRGDTQARPDPFRELREPRG